MGALIDRIKNWKTTLMGSALGVAAAAVVTKLLNDAGCDFSTITWSSFAAFAFTQLMGALSTDNGKAVSLAVLAMLTAGCMSPVTEVTKIGNEYAQQSYSRHHWWPNWDRTVFCDDLASNGYCPKGADEKHTVTAQKAAGQEAAIGAAQNIPMAAGVGVGLSKIKPSNTNQSVSGSQSQTSKNVPVFESPGTVVK